MTGGRSIEVAAKAGFTVTYVYICALVKIVQLLRIPWTAHFVKPIIRAGEVSKPIIGQESIAMREPFV